jgi:hypothetical protein
VALIMESRSGRAAGRPGRNADYNPALTLLLERLAQLDATLADALVDSRKTQALGIPEAERRLITGPVRLAQVPDMEALRVRLGTRRPKSPRSRTRRREVTRPSGSGSGSTFPDTGRARLSRSRASFLCHCRRQEHRGSSWSGWSRPMTKVQLRTTSLRR